MQHYDPFKSMIAPLIKPGMRVLDIGCGDGEFDKQLIAKGVFVSGFDKRNGLSAEEWVARNPDEQYDVILLLDVLQFMEKEFVMNKLLPFCKERLLPDGLLMIESFFNRPYPEFEIKSVYRSEDLWFVSQLESVFLGDSVYQGKGLDGKYRKFYLSQFIGKAV